MDILGAASLEIELYVALKKKGIYNFQKEKSENKSR
jgi:hypothetical protein